MSATWSNWLNKAAAIVPALSGFFFLLSVPRQFRAILLGSDYSRRLYTSIEANMLLVIVVAFYLALARRWIAAAISGLLAVAWFLVGVGNSVV